VAFAVLVTLVMLLLTYTLDYLPLLTYPPSSAMETFKKGPSDYQIDHEAQYSKPDLKSSVLNPTTHDKVPTVGDTPEITDSFTEDALLMEEENSPSSSNMLVGGPESMEDVVVQSLETEPGTPQGQAHGGGQGRVHAYLAAPYLFIMLCIGLGTKGFLESKLLRRFEIPYTVAVLVIGVVLGVAYQMLTDCTPHDCNTKFQLVQSMRLWVNIDPHLLLHLFLPALIFSDSFQLNLHMVKKTFMQCTLLAVPGVLLGTFLTATFAKYVFPYNWDWVMCFMFGSILSATDPVAVLALLKDVGASKNLSMLVAGEALFNDGTALVLFEMYSDILEGLAEFKTEAFVVKFVWMSVGGALIGFAFGMGGSICLAYTDNGTLATIITLAVAYLGFFVADSMVQVSGVLETVAAGVTMSALGRSSIRDPKSLHHVWETIEFCGYTLIFILAGNIFGVVLAEANNGVGVYEWGYLLLLWLTLLLIRAAVVLCFYPVLDVLGYGLHWKDALVLVWGGLRGAVGLAMGIVADEAEFTSPEEGKQVIFYAGGIAFLTVLLNGSTISYTMELLGMLNANPAEDTLISYVRQVVRQRTVEVYHGLCREPLFHFHDANALQAVCPVLLNAHAALPQDAPSADLPLSQPENLDAIRKKMREIYLCVVRSSYEQQIETGALPDGLPSLVLLQSVDSALDFVHLPGFYDWEDVLRTFRSRVSPLKFTFAINHAIRRMVGWVIGGRESMALEEVECAVSLSYVQAHRAAANTLADLITRTKASQSHQDMLKGVVEEGGVLIQDAEHYLSLLVRSHPKLLTKLLTKQLGFKVLATQRTHVEQMQHRGLINHHHSTELFKEIDIDSERLASEYFVSILTPQANISALHTGSDTQLKNMEHPVFHAQSEFEKLPTDREHDRCRDVQHLGGRSRSPSPAPGRERTALCGLSSSSRLSGKNLNRHPNSVNISLEGELRQR